VRVVIAGGSGQLGHLLASWFENAGAAVTILSRRDSGTNSRYVLWDGTTLGPWAQELDGADVVVNLAGRSVNCRYTLENRAAILASRVDSTRVIGEAIARTQRPPIVWLQASTATIYAHRYDAPNDEEHGIIGGEEPDVPPAWHYSIEVATAWEHALAAALTPRTRKVALRTSLVMNTDPGGIFEKLVSLARMRLGGYAGDGQQYVSWIHGKDFARAISWIIDHEELHGVVNVTSPNPLPNAEFMRTLRAACGVRIGLHAPAILAEIGAFCMRTETELILKSRKVVPTKLLDSGFHFDFAWWRDAAADIYSSRVMGRVAGDPHSRG
jgi:uncharacterized protein